MTNSTCTADIVRQYRWWRRMTQTRLGELIGRSKTWIVDLERGRMIPCSPDIQKLASVLGVSESLLWRFTASDILTRKLGPGWNDWVVLGKRS